jgi:ABC-2 type transport system ATP-binding protein
MVWETLTCFEQLVFIGKMYDLRPARARARAASLLEAMGLSDKSHKLAKTLSGGMRRRLNIILALVHEPELVVLDEPQAGLDPQGRVLVRDFIRSLRSACTVILTTHDMEEADRLSDRVAIMDAGRILVLDSPRTLTRKVGLGEVLEILLSEKGSAEEAALVSRLAAGGLSVTRNDGLLLVTTEDSLGAIEAVMRLAKEEGVDLEDIRIRKRSLEDLFIELTGRRLRE